MREGDEGGREEEEDWVEGILWCMWFHDGGCSRAALVDGCFKRHGFRSWARGEQQRAGMVNSYQVYVCVRGRGGDRGARC